MSDTTLNALIAVGMTILTAVAVGMSGLIALGFKRWEMRSKMKMMIELGKETPKAIEQMYPDKTGPEKKELALILANQLGVEAGIKTNGAQLPLNEAGVHDLPDKPQEEPCPNSDSGATQAQ